MHQRAWLCQVKYHPVTKQACGFRIWGWKGYSGHPRLPSSLPWDSVASLYPQLCQGFSVRLWPSQWGRAVRRACKHPTLCQGNAGGMSKQRLGTGWFVIRFQSCQYPSVFVTPHSNLSGTALLQEKPYACWSTEFSHKKKKFKILCFAKQSWTSRALWRQLDQVQISVFFPRRWSRTTSTFLCGWLPLIRRRGGSFLQECAGREQLLLSLVKSHLLSSAALNSLAECDNVSPAVAVIFQALCWVQSQNLIQKGQAGI